MTDSPIEKAFETVRGYILRPGARACADCGYAEAAEALDFDHVRGEKYANVNKLAGSAGWERIMEEVDKCEVVCANCHRIRTRQRSYA